MKKNLGRFAQRGFTLLEVLVVLVIIGLIASLVGPRLFGSVDTAKIQTAAIQIKTLRGAVESMRINIGTYPTTDQGLRLLTTAPVDGDLKNKWKGPYLEEAVPLDPWGNAYVYSFPGKEGQAFSIQSLGADGKPGGEGNDADIGLPKAEGAKP
jgi:general secretion pathway protein G